MRMLYVVHIVAGSLSLVCGIRRALRGEGGDGAPPERDGVRLRDAYDSGSRGQSR
jgi:hypothetical protein